MHNGDSFVFVIPALCPFSFSITAKVVALCHGFMEDLVTAVIAEVFLMLETFFKMLDTTVNKA